MVPISQARSPLLSARKNRIMAKAQRKIIVDYEGESKRMGVNLLTSTNLARIYKELRRGWAAGVCGDGGG